MLTIQRMRGATGATEILELLEPGPGGALVPIEGDGSGVTFTCEVWPSDDLAVVATLPCAYRPNEDPEDPTVRVAVQFPAETMAALDLGWYNARVVKADETRVLAVFRIETTPGPGAGELRPVYCSYKDMLDEQPWLDRLADEKHDQIGFAEARADARDWLDGLILDAFRDRARCGRYGATAHEPAADALRFDTIDGRRLWKAAVYKSVAIVCGRSAGTSAPAGVELRDKADEYEAKAQAAFDAARCAEYSDGTASVQLHGLNVGRLVR